MGFTSMLGGGLRWLLLLVVLAGQGVLHAQTFPLDMCPGDRNGGGLNCTANDVQITKIVITPGSNPPTGCVGGSTLTLSLDVTMQFGSSSRYDIGVFLSQDGRNPKLPSTRTLASGTGSASCSVSTLPLGTMQNGLPSPFPNMESGAAADVCGDGSKATVPTSAYANSFTPAYSTGSGTGTFTIPNVQVTCSSVNAGNLLSIPFVVSWDNQAGGLCTGPQSVVPGTGAKCSYSDGMQGDVAIVTLPSIAKTDGVSSITPSDTTTYTITIANTTGVTITNAVFKDPAPANMTYTGVSCAASGGASCPAAAPTVASVQSGITIASLPTGGVLTYTVNAILSGNPTGTLTNAASITVGGVANTAIDADTITYPSLSNQKTVTVISDPIRGTSNPLSIPGAIAEYAITLTNTGLGKTDKDSAVLTDAIPANTVLETAALAGAPANSPVTFTDGSPSSTLTVASTDIQYSTDGGATWSTTPTVAATHLRVSPKGRMAAGSSFTVKFRVKVN